MRKIFTLLFAFIASIGMMFAYDEGVKIGDLYFGVTIASKTAEVVCEEWDSHSNYATLTVADIPSTITYKGKKYDVTEIGDLAFAYSGVKTVIIPNSVKLIGGSAFEDAHLNSVTIGSGVTRIKSGAFACRIDTVHITDLAAFCKIDFWGRESTPLYRSKVLFVGGKQTSNLVIDRGVTRISDNAFTSCRSITSLTITGSVKSIGEEAFIDCDSLRYVVIGNNVDSLCAFAFCGCDSLKRAIIGHGLTYIGGGAFDGYNWDKSIYCYATVPPEVDRYSRHDGTTYYAVWMGRIYVPSSSVKAYEETFGWLHSYTSIYPIGASYVELDQICVQAVTNTTADVEWLVVDGAASYELEVKDEAGNVFCNTSFDGDGQMSDIIYSSPTRNNAPQQMHNAGFAYTITGLESGATYNVTITAKAANGSILNTETTSLTTMGEPQAIEETKADKLRGTKFVKDGNVYFIRGNKTYTLQGQEVKDKK